MGHHSKTVQPESHLEFYHFNSQDLFFFQKYTIFITNISFISILQIQIFWDLMMDVDQALAVVAGAKPWHIVHLVALTFSHMLPLAGLNMMFVFIGKYHHIHEIFSRGEAGVRGDMPSR